MQTPAGLPLTGSAGGKYTLFPMMTYCVTRASDGARMCAVVPGVPMYDHLLGVKLTIEHDEPMFLKTANMAATTGAMRVLGGVWHSHDDQMDAWGYDTAAYRGDRMGRAVGVNIISDRFERIDPTLPYLDPSDPGT